MFHDDIDLQSIFTPGDVVVAIDEDTLCTWALGTTVVNVYERRPISWSGRDLWRIVDAFSLPAPVTFQDARDAAKDWITTADEKAAREAAEFPF
jgi:hypothetical protein